MRVHFTIIINVNNENMFWNKRKIEMFSRTLADSFTMCYIWLYCVYPAVVWPRAGAGNEGGAPALAAVCPVPRVQVGSGGWLHTGTCRDKTGAAIRSTDGDEECWSGYPHQEAIKPLTRRQNKTITSSSNHKSQAGCLLLVRWPVAVVKWSCHIFPSFNWGIV